MAKLTTGTARFLPFAFACFAAFGLSGALSGCQTRVAQQIREDVRDVPDVLRTFGQDVKCAATTAQPCRPGTEAP